MHRILKRVEGLRKEDLYQIILDRYSKVCGNHEKKIFEERILPNAFKIFEGEPQALVVELFRIIEYAKDYKINKIEDYLTEVALRFSNPRNSLKKIINNI